MTVLQPFATKAEGGRAIWHLGALMQFKATGKDTGGQFWLAEQTSNRGYASPLHRHTREDELFIVLDGELTVQVGETVHQVEAGGLAFAPRQLPHTFSVVSPTARFYILSTPAGLENWFFETGEEAGSLTVPAPSAQLPDFGRLIASLAPHGVDFLGPPPGHDLGAPPAEREAVPASAG